MITDFVLWWIDGIFECLIPGKRWNTWPGHVQHEDW